MIYGLYAITDPVLIPPKQFRYKIEACLGAGCKLIQFRDKSSPDIKLPLATQLQEICSRYGATLIINDDMLLAKKIGASGIHLGVTDTPIGDARAQLPKHCLIGATCHASIDLAQSAVSAGASYLAFGRFFESHTKPNAPAADLNILSQAKSTFKLPVVAIGGITLKNVAQVIEHGADAVAVCNDVFALDEARDIETRVKQYRQLFNENL